MCFVSKRKRAKNQKNNKKRILLFCFFSWRKKKFTFYFTHLNVKIFIPQMSNCKIFKSFESLNSIICINSIVLFGIKKLVASESNKKHVKSESNAIMTPFRCGNIWIINCFKLLSQPVTFFRIFQREKLQKQFL